MKKTYKEFQEQVLEKTLSPEDIDDLIDKSIEGVFDFRLKPSEGK